MWRIPLTYIGGALQHLRARVIPREVCEFQRGRGDNLLLVIVDQYATVNTKDRKVQTFLAKS